MGKTLFILYCSLSILFLSCLGDNSADLLIHNAQIYDPVSKKYSKSIFIKDGKILEILDENLPNHSAKAKKTIDAQGHFLMPGFIEGHGHFHGLGTSLQLLNFIQDTSWQQSINKVFEKSKDSEKGSWIYGRGWHQEKWLLPYQNIIEGYPNHPSLSELTQDNPVILFHASGHALFANKTAMDLAGLTKETQDPLGGKIIRDLDGNPTGVFEERAMDLIQDAYKAYIESLPVEETIEKWHDAIDLAQEACLKNGITSFQDAGSSFEELERYEALAIQKKLDIRLWAMLRESHDDMKNVVGDYIKIDVGDAYFTCNAIKTELDGALGSHGAWLLKAYCDKANFTGQNTTEIPEVTKIAKLAFDHGMQLCVHAIGDKANRKTLDIFERYQNQTDTTLRWRVEHAQHLDSVDIPRFAKIGAIASMQGKHCTSDAPFVVKRLCQHRAKTGAYAWRSLLDAGVVVSNGTDTPVEDVNPIESYYATVTRKRLDDGSIFFEEQKMTREEALYSYTYAPAFATFQEDQKGSIEVGKFADLVILDQNLLTCSENDIPKTKVLYTIVNGNIKFKTN